MGPVGDFGPTGPTGPTGPAGTGPTGPNASIVSALVSVSLAGLMTTAAVQDSVDTGISSSQALWLTGYDLASSTGLVALQGVYFSGPGAYATWRAVVSVLALESAATSATVRVFYTYTA